MHKFYSLKFYLYVSRLININKKTAHVPDGDDSKKIPKQNIDKIVY